MPTEKFPFVVDSTTSTSKAVSTISTSATATTP
jgi:hypothetical protein